MDISDTLHFVFLRVFFFHKKENNAIILQCHIMIICVPCEYNSPFYKYEYCSNSFTFTEDRDSYEKKNSTERLL